MKRAVVLFNLGGPSSLDQVEPFLRNLFSDPAILTVPGFVRGPLARFIAKRRAPVAREIYAKLGGGSPILPQTQAQAAALENLLPAKVFVSMRYSVPFSDETARAVKAWGAEHVVLLPLYPQFSTTTTASSFADWDRAARKAGLTAPCTRIRSYAREAGFVRALAELTGEALAQRKTGLSYRLLFSAHGLPERIVAAGDPYPGEVEQTAAALAEALEPGLDWRVCYQSRVGPLKWIGPATDEEIRRAGAEGKGVIVVPLAFVSEHSETLVELDMEYAHLAQEAGVSDYLRVPTVQTHPAFIAGLAGLIEDALKAEPR